MKVNQFEKTKKEVVDIGLHSLCEKFRLDEETKTLAERLFSEYASKNLVQEEFKSTYMKSAVFLASKMQVINRQGNSVWMNGISLPYITKRQYGDISQFLLRLKDLVNFIQIDQKLKSEITQIIKNFSYSTTFFNKYAQWCMKIFDIRENAKVFQLGWIIFISNRFILLNRRFDQPESICLIAAVLILIIYFFPQNSQIFIKSDKSLEIVCSLTKTKVEYIQKMFNHLMQTLNAWKEHGYLQGFQGSEFKNKVDGIMEPKFINYNIWNLGQYYEDKLTLDDIDERYFIFKEEQPQNVANALFLRQSQQRLQNLKIFHYETNENVSMNANLRDIQFQESPSLSTTNMSQQQMKSNHLNCLQESLNWFEDHIYKVQAAFDGVMTNSLRLIFNKCDPLILEEFTSRLTKNYINITQELEDNYLVTNQDEKSQFLLAIPKINTKTEQTLLLYIRILEELLRQESKRKEQINFQALMENGKLHQAILSCAFETVLFVNNVCFISFEKLLKVVNISCFDFWKLINSFLQFDQKMPVYLKKHFRDIEIKILCQLAWRSDSAVQQMISKYIAFQEMQSRQLEQSSQENEENQIEKQIQSQRHPSYDMFFRRVLHCSAHKILELTEAINLSEKLKEQCWMLMKITLSENTELLFDRHLDILIVCTVYGICKMYPNLHQITTMNNLVSRFRQLYLDDLQGKKLFQSIKLQEETNGDIIKFYNQVYIPKMKSQIISIVANESIDMANQVKNPRIDMLYTNSSLNQSMPQNIQQIIQQNKKMNILKSPLKNEFTSARSVMLHNEDSPSQISNRSNQIDYENNKRKSFSTESSGEIVDQKVKKMKLFNNTMNNQL